MNVGKLVRLNRLFSHSSGRLFSVAVDHFSGYQEGLPVSLREIEMTLASIVAETPDAVTMHIGVALNAWKPFAGRVPLILQSVIGRPDDTIYQQIALPEDAVRVGADGFAVATYVRGKTEGQYLRLLADSVREAARFEMPVICHIYPRRFSDVGAVVSYEPEDIGWAVHCAVECGADVIKVPYCGEVSAYAEIVRSAPVPVVAAGGPRQDSLLAALGMIREVIESGARGATVGRNVWGFESIATAIRAFKAVIHDGEAPERALGAASRER
ncbi:MAG TPA: aldolase [Spirochaetia bacterium]|nr:aldolase [Spirochaetia bacterium]